MDSRCRGANGEVGGEAGDEYALWCSFATELRRYRCRNGNIMGNSLLVLQNLIREIER